MCVAQQQAHPDTAWCWTHYSFAIDTYFQVSLCFGGERDDVHQEQTDRQTEVQYGTVEQVYGEKPKPAKKRRAKR
jgi:hypothetical protein